MTFPSFAVMLSLELPQLFSEDKFMAKQLLITEYGANTAYENNAPYIQAAIDAVGPEDEVVIPAGTWKTTCGRPRRSGRRREEPHPD